MFRCLPYSELVQAVGFVLKVLAKLVRMEAPDFAGKEMIGSVRVKAKDL